MASAALAWLQSSRTGFPRESPKDREFLAMRDGILAKNRDTRNPKVQINIEHSEECWC